MYIEKESINDRSLWLFDEAMQMSQKAAQKY